MTATLVAPRDGKKTTGVPTSGLMLGVGHPKSGKSTTFAKFKNAYVLMLEKSGGDRIDGKGLRIHDITETVDEKSGAVLKTALEEFGDVLELVLNDASINTVVIDTIDELVMWFEDDILRSMGKDPKSGKPTEKDFVFWNELKTRIRAFAEYMKDSGKLVILVAHCKAPEKDSKGNVIVPAGINVPGKGGAYLAAQAEMIAYISKRIIGRNSVQYMSFNAPSDMALWGSRLEELDGKEFEVPKANPYEAFAANFKTNGKAKPKTKLRKKNK